jgi:hypothetical protein
VFNFLFGTKMSDVLSGMYLLRTDVAREMSLQTTGFNVEVEIAAQVVSVGNVTEVPINYRTRVGRQKLSTWKDGPRILSATFQLARLYNPAFIWSFIAGLTAIPGVALLLFELYRWLSEGRFGIGVTIMGVALVLFGSEALAAGTISVLIKHSEGRLRRQMKRLEREEVRDIEDEIRNPRLQRGKSPSS